MGIKKQKTEQEKALKPLAKTHSFFPGSLHQTPLLPHWYLCRLRSVPSVGQGTAMVEGRWCLQSGHSGFCMLLLLCSFPPHVFHGFCPVRNIHSAMVHLLARWPHSSLAVSLWFPPSLHVPPSFLWHILSFLKYIFREATPTSKLSFGLQWVQSYLELALSSIGQGRPWPSSTQSPPTTPHYQNLATPMEKLLSALPFQTENPYSIITKNWIESSEVWSSPCSYQLSWFLSSQPAS